MPPGEQEHRLTHTKFERGYFFGILLFFIFLFRFSFFFVAAEPYLHARLYAALGWSVMSFLLAIPADINTLSVLILDGYTLFFGVHADRALCFLVLVDDFLGTL